MIVGTEHQGHVSVCFPVFDPGAVTVQMGFWNFKEMIMRENKI